MVIGIARAPREAPQWGAIPVHRHGNIGRIQMGACFSLHHREERKRSCVGV